MSQSKAHAGHSHAIPATTNVRALRLALVLTGAFMLVELSGGIWAGSLALISDAAHMLTDVAALAIALVAIHVGQRRADSRRTYGYQRIEILAAAFNASLLFLVAGYILYEAYRRLREPAEVHSTAMLLIAGLGLVVNITSMRVLSAGKEASLNVKGAYLEVWSDMLGSVGVIVAAIVIRFSGWTWVDSVVAVAIGLWVLPRTWTLLRESLNVLLEGVPAGLDLVAVEQTIRGVPGVLDLHDLHVWSITTDKTNLTVHLCIDPTANASSVIRSVSAGLYETYHIEHTTIQCEVGPCPNATAAVHGLTDAPRTR